VKFFIRSVFFLILFFIIFYFYAGIVEPMLLMVKYENIYSNLIVNENIKIVQFSDVHISEFFDLEYLKKTVKKINDENPHIVVFTGDLIDEYNKYKRKENINEIGKVLGEIHAPFGKYAVYGNHDYGGGAERVFRKVMEDSGFKLLLNERVYLKEYNISIIGMDDSIFGRFEKEVIASYLDENSFNIILSHEPDVAEYFFEHNLDLFISGHSHGGQINLPFINYNPPLAKKYVRGMYVIDNFRRTKIYVNVGLGTSQIPMRFMAPPELTVFNLYGMDE
jgi:predicted MPP superfamily phosphohydrolase